jgi:pimeloyl-ACP methyl ester carboxylesterase
MSLPGTRFRIGELNFNVRIEGTGPDVLLLHGFPDSNAVWRHQIPALVAAGYRVIAPDLRGFGETDAPAGKEHYAGRLLLGDVVGIMDAVGAQRVRLVGHDWGAALGWLLSIAQPQRVDRYAALSVGHMSAYVTAPLKQRMLAWYIFYFQIEGMAERELPADDWKMMREFLRHHPELDTHWIPDFSRPGRLVAGLNWYRANMTMFEPRVLPDVTVPVMGVWSDQDLALCEEQMTSSARYVRGPWLYEKLAGVGHWMQLDAPERVNELLLDFLR